MTATVMVVCVRHRWLWRFGRRWHFHLVKPVERVGSFDFKVLDNMADSLSPRWVVEVVGQERMDLPEGEE